METFSIVKREDINRHGTYRTKEAILEIYDAIFQSQHTGCPYQTRLDAPPAAPGCAPNWTPTTPGSTAFRANSSATSSTRPT